MIRKAEAMNRPKKEFIPTSLSDLNIDAISIGSNSDRHNNNSNGARLNNFDRFKATSSSNLSYKHSNLTNSNNNNFGASHSSKLYGSQSNLSVRSSSGASSTNHIYQPVVYNRNYNINSPKSTASDGTDKWLQAWEDTNNNNSYRAPSYHPSNAHQQQQRQHSKVSQNVSNNFNSNNNNHNRQSVVDPFDPFEDPWSGISSLFLNFSSFLCTLQKCTTFSQYFLFFF